MSIPLINFEYQTWYCGLTCDDGTMNIPFQGVQLSYNLDTLMEKTHPHENDFVLAPVRGFVLGPIDYTKCYTFLQPVIDEQLFFNRESFIRRPIPLLRARLIQRFNFKTMFTSKGD